MKKIFLHVGFAKCGSTSLQAALSRAPGILFPTSGNHGGEHLAFILGIRGIDDWTRQYFNESWVERENIRLMTEIHEGIGTIVLSSERLAASTPLEIERIGRVLAGFEVHIVIVKRDIQKYLNSTWRHAVFFHDFGESYDSFVSRFENFSFGDIESKFSQFFQVHCFNMDSPQYLDDIGGLLGTKLDIEHLNVGVPMDFAKLLQKTHSLLGSRDFKERFSFETKQSMLAMWNGEGIREMDSLDVDLF